MKYLLPFTLLLLLVSLHSCGLVSKPTNTSTASNQVSKVVKEAKKYLGTPYRYGGDSKKGMDCSGLIFKSYEAINKPVPRVSREQAKLGYKVKLSKVKQGDLLFFNTSGSGVSHVGIVENVVKDEVFFIHASSSRGVMVSSLENSYWKPRFLFAKRVL